MKGGIKVHIKLSREKKISKISKTSPTKSWSINTSAKVAKMVDLLVSLSTLYCLFFFFSWHGDVGKLQWVIVSEDVRDFSKEVPWTNDLESERSLFYFWHWELSIFGVGIQWLSPVRWETWDSRWERSCLISKSKAAIRTQGAWLKFQTSDFVRVRIPLLSNALP